MENMDQFSVEVQTYTESLPEGEFHTVRVDLGEFSDEKRKPVIVARARSKAIAVALAFEKLATEIKKKHYESKGVPYGAV